MLKKFYHKNTIEAGCDEAGRGCFAGPVVAAAVILPPDFYHPLLNDSKKLSAAVREELKIYIQQNAICYAVAEVDNKTIDNINILQAAIRAMHTALNKLTIRPEHIIVDGNYFKPFKNIPHQTIVGGDGKYNSIAAASILAKTYRDEIMKKLHKKFPQYNWQQNKGYGTEQHRQAIQEFGLTPLHRESFCGGISFEC